MEGKWGWGRQDCVQEACYKQVWCAKGSGYRVGRKVIRVWAVEEVEGRMGGGRGRVMDEEGWVDNNGGLYPVWAINDWLPLIGLRSPGHGSFIDLVRLAFMISSDLVP